MNERIRELAEQAGFIPGIMGLTRFTYFDPEKFAELIVRECVDIALVSSHKKDDMGSIIANNIKKHFGVEE